MSHVRITHSLYEIENIYKAKPNGNVTTNCQAMAYSEVNKYVNGNVERVWQEIPISSLINIVYVFKSNLLAFFLELNKNIEAGIDFSKIEGQKVVNQIMNTYYINSLVANTGDGIVNTGDISGNNLDYILDSNQKEKIRELVSKLIEEAANIDNADLEMAIDTINEECKKPSWAKKTLKLAFNAVQGIATGIAANQLTPIITQALALL